MHASGVRSSLTLVQPHERNGTLALSHRIQVKQTHGRGCPPLVYFI